MSFGIAFRNGIAIGLGSVVSLFSGYGRDQVFDNLITEIADNLVQEDGSFILV